MDEKKLLTNEEVEKVSGGTTVSDVIKEMNEERKCNHKVGGTMESCGYSKCEKCKKYVRSWEDKGSKFVSGKFYCSDCAPSADTPKEVTHIGIDPTTILPIS